MRIQRPGSEICRAWPPDAEEEDQARFYFRAPDAAIGRKVLRLTLKMTAETFHDTAQKILGLVLDRVENLSDDSGHPIEITKSGEQLSEESLSALHPILTDLMDIAADLCRLKSAEEKN